MAGFRGRKVYGQSRVLTCPFCGKQCTTQNAQGVPTCVQHKKELLADLKCACGEYLELLQGKWGPFGVCSQCGSMNLKKVLELNPIKKCESPSGINGVFVSAANKEKRDVVITSDEVDLFYS